MMQVFSFIAITFAFGCIRASLIDLDELNISSDFIADQFKNGTKIEELIWSQIDEIKSIMIHGDRDNGIPTLDPYYQNDKIPNSFQVKTSFANAEVKIDDAKVTGLSKFKLTQLSVDVEKKSMSLALEVPKLDISGLYKTTGTFNMFGEVDVEGMGPFKASLIKPSIKIIFMINNDNGTNDFSVSGSSVSVDYEDVDLQLDGFMPGKPLGPIILRAIKSKSREYFDESREELEDKISQFMSSTLNSIFDTVLNKEDQPEEEEEEEESHVINKRQTCGSGNMNSYIDQVIKNAQPLIKAKSEPLKLSNFKKIVHFYDGNVYGLSSIYRNGDVILSCTSSTLSLKVNFGFGRVSAGYRWYKKILFHKKRGSARVSFKSIGVSAKISQSRTPNAHPVINSLDLSVHGIGVHLSGLSIFGHILGAVVGLIGNIFRKAVANALEHPIKKVLQKEFNKITLPF